MSSKSWHIVHFNVKTGDMFCGNLNMHNEERGGGMVREGVG